MARTSTYLNFPGYTEEVFHFYRTIFGGDFIGGIYRLGDTPPQPDSPPIMDEEKNLVMHIELAITGGHILMGTDVPPSMGFQVTFGNNMSLNLEPDTKAETDRLFSALSAGGTVEMPLQDMFWGAYYGCCQDKFGVRWMFNCTSKT